MAITTILAIYFITWWLVLFMVLPWGAHSQEDSGEVTPGTDPGAPAVHRVWKKLLLTTIIASIVFAILAAIYEAGLIPYDFLKEISAPPRR